MLDQHARALALVGWKFGVQKPDLSVRGYCWHFLCVHLIVDHHVQESGAELGDESAVPAETRRTAASRSCRWPSVPETGGGTAAPARYFPANEFVRLFFHFPFYPWKLFVRQAIVEDPERVGAKKLAGEWIRQDHRDVAQHFLVRGRVLHSVQENLQLSRLFGVDIPLPDAGVQTPGELVARIHLGREMCEFRNFLVRDTNRRDLLHFGVVQGHQKFGSQSAEVNTALPEQEGPDELQDHVVQHHALPDHLDQLLDSFALSSNSGRGTEERAQIIWSGQPSLCRINSVVGVSK